jgi:hypothetical protein
VSSSDFLGQSNPLSLSALTQDEGKQTHALELYDTNYKHIGNLNISTKFVYAPIDPLPQRLNAKCTLAIKIVQATFLKDHDLFGK